MKIKRVYISAVVIVFLGILILFNTVQQYPSSSSGQYQTFQESKQNVTIVCVSDTHGIQYMDEVLKIPQGDILVFAGDIELHSLEDAIRFNYWLGKLPHKHKIITFGNMDLWAEKRENITNILNNATVLINSYTQIDGISFFGSPYTPPFVGVFQLQGDNDESFWNNVMEKDKIVDVMVTHGPPYGFGDVTRGIHRGDKGLLKVVNSLPQLPKLWVVGHIHESYGAHKMSINRSDILLINAGVAYLANGREDAQPYIVQYPSLSYSKQGTLQP